MTPTADRGFCFPIKELANDIAKLVPFQESIHTAALFAGIQNHPEVFSDIEVGPFRDEHELTADFLRPLQADPNATCFAIIDKRRPPSAVDTEGELAGLICYDDASTEHQKVEIDYVVILPAFQRTRIGPAATELLMRYALDPPRAGGLGLRRVQASVQTTNPGSRLMFRRLGFREEGVARWIKIAHDAVARQKQGNGRPLPGDDGTQRDHGRDFVLLALTWDDWLEKESAQPEVVSRARL